jgi:hypothetical protein
MLRRDKEKCHSERERGICRYGQAVWRRLNPFAWIKGCFAVAQHDTFLLFCLTAATKSVIPKVQTFLKTSADNHSLIFTFTFCLTDIFSTEFTHNFICLLT